MKKPISDAKKFALEIFNTYMNWNTIKPRPDDYLLQELEKLHEQAYPPNVRGERIVTVRLTEREANALYGAAKFGSVKDDSAPIDAEANFLAIEKLAAAIRTLP